MDKLLNIEDLANDDCTFQVIMDVFFFGRKLLTEETSRETTTRLNTFLFNAHLRKTQAKDGLAIMRPSLKTVDF